MVLQDLVNELGRRLGYVVENGRYQGIRNANGFDGLWQSPEGHSVVVEVKTTDTYRISLDSIVSYRTKLIEASKIVNSSSVLIVVGRDDTGDLEAQVRGSRHAWDVRLISADALIKLVQLKENTEATETELKIRNLLIPTEYTRLDNIIDVMFTTAVDLESTSSSNTDTEIHSGDQVDVTIRPKGIWDFTSKALVTEKKDQIITALNKHFEKTFIRRKGAYYWDKAHEYLILCTISKRYVDKGLAYWYGYHHEWRDFLLSGNAGYLVLGCMDLDAAFVIPVKDLEVFLPILNTTMISGKVDYWHIRVAAIDHGQYGLIIPNTKPFSLRPYHLLI
jgi:hypothetical protein